MERDDAIQEVQDIKRIMEESRRRASPTYPTAGVVLLVAAIAAMLFLPIVAPLISLAMVVGGTIVYVRSQDRGERTLAAVAMAVGAVVLLLTLLVFIILVPVGRLGVPVAVGGIGWAYLALAAVAGLVVLAVGITLRARRRDQGEGPLAVVAIIAGALMVLAALGVILLISLVPSSSEAGDEPLTLHEAPFQPLEPTP